MKVNILVWVLAVGCILGSCKANRNATAKNDLEEKETSDAEAFTIAFGSCNKTSIKNFLWDDIIALEPDLWIWGGDNIYADTEDIQKLQQLYGAQKGLKGYRELRAAIPVIGTWDDHDYGVNDGGSEFPVKKESQQAFLDFMDVPMDSPRRTQEGIYTSHEYRLPDGRVKVIVLDTRYFRTPLTLDTVTVKRTKSNAYGDGTILGDKQWEWLTKELNASDANFNVIVSSIQVLSNEHGWETWGNFPHEVDRLKKTIADSGAAGVLILSGDRHISEFSQTSVADLDYPLVDFTSSGLTHAVSNFKGEPNPFRVGSVVSDESFGLLRFDFLNNTVSMKMIGDNGQTLHELDRSYGGK
ncbi:alkaline phosphatase D family protein [Maribacter sp. 2-571]|uniref:alkaline phosphatase D family protein n=1 Tax=Maribacter sp. 2-571 TaxID=3417569 RepID=UPI003D34B9A4